MKISKLKISHSDIRNKPMRLKNIRFGTQAVWDHPSLSIINMAHHKSSRVFSFILNATATSLWQKPKVWSLVCFNFELQPLPEYHSQENPRVWPLCSDSLLPWKTSTAKILQTNIHSIYINRC